MTVTILKLLLTFNIPVVIENVNTVWQVEFKIYLLVYTGGGSQNNLKDSCYSHGQKFTCTDFGLVKCSRSF